MDLNLNSKNMIIIMIVLLIIYLVLQKKEGYKAMSSIPASYRMCDGGMNNLCYNLSEHQKNKNIYYGNSIDGFVKIPFNKKVPDYFACVPHGEPSTHVNKKSFNYKRMPVDFKPFKARKNKNLDKLLPPEKTAEYSTCFVHSQDDASSFFNRHPPIPLFRPI
jgi:hypothetical protein